MAVTTSIVQAAAEQLHRIKAMPAAVAGAIAAAASAARCRRVTLHRHRDVVTKPVHQAFGRERHVDFRIDWQLHGLPNTSESKANGA